MRPDPSLKPTPTDMEIQPATPDDAEAISALIQSVAHQFTLHPQGLGAEAFMEGIAPDAIRRYVAAPNFRYFVGRVDGKLAGVVAVRDAAHLFHLFVAAPYQGRWLGRALWLHARAAALADRPRGRITVNSTPFAEPVYARFGFQPTGPRTEVNGIAFIPMAMLPAGEDAGAGRDCRSD